MSDTPRTNAAKHNMGSVAEPHYVVDIEVAECLERKLVEARKDALEDAAQVCDSESSCEGIAQKCAVAIRAMKEGWK